ncbi:M23 family metallopeptidase [Microlunatus elymi]|uniref:M23 family metallopeptidase n=1 Tax=Microlunatus elymi TaxID=2596828 RepID=A0A516PUK5_9ACTN|nr:M23 family metallopeptidase [Microlunatus elymi]QDP94810.1 M23 family metallopeptidase [Microlunatus elymi]
MDPKTAQMAVQIGLTLARSKAVRYVIVGSILASMLAVLSLTFGPWILTTQLAASMSHHNQQQSTDGGTCSDTTGTSDTTGDGQQSASNLTAAQVGNAKIIWTVAQSMSLGRQAAVIGIATALQESGLQNLPHGDRDSVGLFQQRASWGSYTERTNPQTSSRLFFQALKKIHGWELMSVAAAAQAVQRSAFPGAYAKHEKAAAGVVATIESKAEPGTVQAQIAAGSAMCGTAAAESCPPTGMAVEAGLTPDALRVLRCVKQRWPQLTSFGGIGERPSNVDRDHQDGRAIDAMIPNYHSDTGRKLGKTIADWAVDNRQRLGVKYVIWNAQIWNAERAKEGWRVCAGPDASCYSGPDDTAAHRDHVHISVYGNHAGQTAADTGTPVLPVEQYVLTARFGQCSSHWANCHTGLDFAAPTGTPIHATLPGTVIWTGWGGAYGNLTKVQNGGGVQTWYAHQSAVDVKVGDTVTAGQLIGQVGATGNTTGPHLHLEARVAGNPVDPDQWLTMRGVKP